MEIKKFENVVWLAVKEDERDVIEVREAPQMDVRLVSYPKDIEKLIAFAARATYKGHVAETVKDVPLGRALNMVQTVVECGHGSVWEHAVFTFDIRNISRACTHQIVRHRMASYTQESQHYISYDKLMVVRPDKLDKNQLTMFTEACKEAFMKYRGLIESGYPHSEARSVLPNAVAARLVMTVNARSLYNFFGLRCCARNTWEIHTLAWKMLAMCKEISPTLFAAAGPRCWQLGFCPEGRNTCGTRDYDVREFGALRSATSKKP